MLQKFYHSQLLKGSKSTSKQHQAGTIIAILAYLSSSFLRVFQSRTWLVSFQSLALYWQPW